ncbi:hypothetical protein JW921_00835 [Candidatus Fermentibacterales bacterium]|nr:hypothetical protein [Candidatus Fermentibacterales bacterium]
MRKSVTGAAGSRTRRALPAVAVSLALAVLVGCQYGLLQPAHNLGEGRYVFRGGLWLPAFLDPDDRKQAEETRQDYLEVFPGGSFMIGATDRIDLGFSFMSYGLGPQFRIGALPPEDPLALCGMLDVNYVIPVKVISPRLSLMAGRKLGYRFEVYGGYQVGYGPDLANLPELPDSDETDWDSVENDSFHGITIGCYYEIKTEEEGEGYGWLVPEAIAIEFTMPLGFERPVIITGLGVTY